MYARKGGKLVHPGFAKAQARKKLAAPGMAKPTVGPRPGAQKLLLQKLEALKARQQAMKQGPMMNQATTPEMAADARANEMAAQQAAQRLAEFRPPEMNRIERRLPGGGGRPTPMRKDKPGGYGYAREFKHPTFVKRRQRRLRRKLRGFRELAESRKQGPMY